MTAPRIVVAGATTAISRRTTLRKGFLGAWDPRVQQAWLYSLAAAQQATGVAVHHGITVVNHHHLTVTPQSDNLPEFLHQFHTDVSRSINTLLTHERYDAPRELFDGRSTHCMRLLDDAAQGSHLVYEHVNCVAAGLVDRPEHMPGYSLDFELWNRGYLEVRRPDFYFGEGRPEVLRLELTPPPLLYRAFGGDLDKLVYHMKRTAEHAVGTLRRARSRPAMGARQVRRLHPWSEPKTLRERGGQRVPTFRIGARDILGQEASVAAATETHHFHREHGQARVARAAGDFEQRFPFGTYQMRVLHGAPVQQAPEAALVTAPGPLLCDVQAELEAQRRAGLRTEALARRRFQLIDEVQEAFEQEAEALCEHAELDLQPERHSPVVSVGRDEAPGKARGKPRPEGLTRHRFDRSGRKDPAQQAGPEGARRLVVLRDRRKGRPPGRPNRHGSDPPV